MMTKLNLKLNNKFRVYSIVLILFLLLSLLNTYPLFLHLSSSQLGDGGDGPEFMWDLWWFNYAVTHFQNPYHTDFIFYPSGTYLYLHSLTPLNGLLSMPFQWVFSGNMVLVYNLVILLDFILAGFAMFILINHFVKNKFASFIGGYIFAFSPYMIGHALGHLNLVTLWPLPLFALYFIRFCEDNSIKNGILTITFLVASTLGSWYCGIFAFLFMFSYLIYFIIQKKFKLSREFLIKFAGIILLYFLVMSPLIVGLTSAFFSGNYVPDPNPDTWTSNPDLLNFFFPGGLLDGRVLFDQLAWWTATNNPYNFVEVQNFLGYATIILAVIGIILVFRKKVYSKGLKLGFWVFLFALSFIFALGTKLKVLGRILNFHLPYHYVFVLFPFESKPGRFVVLIFLALSLLSAIGIDELSRKIKKRWRWLFYFFIFSVIVLEFLAIPYKITPYSAPEFYYQLSSQQGDFAVYDLSHIDNFVNYTNLYQDNSAVGFHMYYQTISGKKIIDGRTSRPPYDSYFFSKDPLLNESYLEHSGVKYVICSEGSSLCKNFRNYNKVYEDSSIEAYQIIS